MKQMDHEFILTENNEIIEWTCECGLIITFIKAEDVGFLKKYIHDKNISLTTHEKHHKLYMYLPSRHINEVRNFNTSTLDEVYGKLKLKNHKHDFIKIKSIMEE